MRRGLPETDFDYLLVGGGLQTALIALALRLWRPRATVAIVEKGAALGGNHLWCFHAQDVPAAWRELVEPLVVHRWPGYDVRFPALSRRLDEPYAAVTSERLDAVVRERLAGHGNQVFLGAEAREVAPHAVTLADGRKLRGGVVIQARGPAALPATLPAGYQKFVGLELALPAPTALTRPVLMDATVPQLDGFRFLYVLPLSPRRVLLEDTRFSSSPLLDVGALRREILDYARGRGLEGTPVREEVGVLPLPLGLPRRNDGPPLHAGYEGGWLHPTTGYSFPTALRLADHVARTDPGELFGAGWDRLAGEHRQQLRYAVLLNHLLFGAFAPERRLHVFEHFYALPVETIRRFYALSLTWRDRLRILSGGPPKGISMARLLKHVASGDEVIA